MAAIRAVGLRGDACGAMRWTHGETLKYVGIIFRSLKCGRHASEATIINTCILQFI